MYFLLVIFSTQQLLPFVYLACILYTILTYISDNAHQLFTGYAKQYQRDQEWADMKILQIEQKPVFNHKKYIGCESGSRLLGTVSRCQNKEC